MSKAFRKLKTYLDLDDPISFGKYYGKSIQYVIDNDPKYLDWAIKQNNLIFVSDEVLLKMELAINARKKKTNTAYTFAMAMQGVYDKHGISEPLDDWEEDVPF